MELILCIVVDDWTGWLAAVATTYPELLDGTEAITISGVRFSLDACHPDPKIPAAFRYAACRVNPSLDERDFAALEDHGAVIYAVSPSVHTDDQAFGVAQAALTLAAVAADTGALGIKVESSGIAHHPRRWISLQEQVGEAVRQRVAGNVDAAGGIFAAMIQAFVRLPIESGEELHTCGMHLLGRPDVAVPKMDPHEAVGWLRSFALYQTAEAPPGALKSGQGFRLEPGGERRVLHQRDEVGWYPVDDPFHNPWGAWLLASE